MSMSRHPQDDAFYALGSQCLYVIVSDEYLSNEKSDSLESQVKRGELTIDYLFTIIDEDDPNLDRYCCFTLFVGKEVKERLCWVAENKIAYFKEEDPPTYLDFDTAILKIFEWNQRVEKLKDFT